MRAPPNRGARALFTARWRDPLMLLTRVLKQNASGSAGARLATCSTRGLHGRPSVGVPNLAIPTRDARTWRYSVSRSFRRCLSGRLGDTACAARRRNRSRCKPLAHVEVWANVVWISGTYTELDVGVHDRLAALGAHHSGDDLVVRLMVMQDHGRASPVVKPPVAPSEHAREDREEVTALLREQVLVAWRIVLVEALRHNASVDQPTEPVRQRVAGDVQGSLEFVEAGQTLQRVTDDE